jgi:hypothetical protein
MPRRGKRGAKSGAIRAYITEHPDAKASEVVAALAAQTPPVKITPQQVYTLRNNDAKKAGRKPVSTVMRSQPPKERDGESRLYTAKDLAKAFDLGRSGLDMDALKGMLTYISR